MTPYELKACKTLVVIGHALDPWQRRFVLDCLRFHWDRPLTEKQVLKLAEIADRHLPDRYLHMGPSSTPDQHPGEAVREDDQRGRGASSLGPELSRIIELQQRRGWSKATP
jgi:hypothetical protein